MPRTKEQKQIFNEKISQARELFNKVKKNIKDSRTRFNYSYIIENSNNMKSIDKAIRELTLFDKYKGTVKKGDLVQLKKHDNILEKLNIKSNANKQLYRKVLDVIGNNENIQILNTGLRRNKEDVMEIIIKKK